MSLTEITIAIALGVALTIVGLVRWSGVLAANEAEGVAFTLNRAAVAYARANRCTTMPVDGGPGTTITATLPDLLAGGYLPSSVGMDLGGEMVWSVTVTPAGTAIVAGTTTNTTYRARIAAKMKGTITGNTVSFMALTPSAIVDDSHIREWVDLQGGPCPVVTS